MVLHKEISVRRWPLFRRVEVHCAQWSGMMMKLWSKSRQLCMTRRKRHSKLIWMNWAEHSNSPREEKLTMRSWRNLTAIGSWMHESWNWQLRMMRMVIWKRRNWIRQIWRLNMNRFMQNSLNWWTCACRKVTVRKRICGQWNGLCCWWSWQSLWFLSGVRWSWDEKWRKT